MNGEFYMFYIYANQLRSSLSVDEWKAVPMIHRVSRSRESSNRVICAVLFPGDVELTNSIAEHQTVHETT